ncbi:hypothetical protein L7F22_024889 [Adiantum nelumboides]|nr:hypothetical protein [Adiantum nelumboides]
MVLDACIDAIANTTVVDACTNDMVDASIDCAADGNVNDGGIEIIVPVVIDAILDVIVAMDTNATVGSGTNAIVDASTDFVADGNVNDGRTKSIVHNVIDAILGVIVVAMGTNATFESGTDAIVDAMIVDVCTDAIADATIVDACTNDIVDAMEVDASTDATAKAVCLSDATDNIVVAEEAKGTDVVIEDMKEENTHNTTEACIEQNNEAGKGTKDLSVRGYTDSNYAGDLDKRRSTSCYVFTLAGGAVSWQSQLQDCITQSTIEAEYVAANEACKEAIWLGRLVADLGIKVEMLELYCDSHSAIQLAKNSMFHSKTKHINVKYHFIREVIEDKQIQLVKIHMKDNSADLLTKRLSRESFVHCRELLGISYMTAM